MATALRVFLLCLQVCLLTHALDCAGKGADCADTQVTEVKVQDNPFSFLLRTRRQAQAQQGPHRAGSYSVKGSSNKLIQMAQPDRSRRHLQHNKKKPHRSRIGSFSLLDHNRETHPLQVVSVHKHFNGAAYPKMSALKSMKKRSRRSAPKRNKNTRNITCS
ncbi:uncharacterized protein si:dkey-12l12.1 [Triplophysa rosa]|uniref:Uncharacterized protein n=1 Tax=Triplophysa rosa TaxID=992332 RepID=A0A9W7TA23_TRIRA|nr:uncharacterized protein si:dkey-12l12.1 [Triplophysa rosa]KAI7792352.1 hypothetical protein IRJ41_006306 [Triplophysa rosa]